MNPSHQILNSLRRIVRELRLSATTSGRKLGLSSAQLFVLNCLRPGERISVNEAAARTCTDQSSVSVVISKLVAKSLVKRSRSRDDRRKQLIELTAKGIAIAARSTPLVQSRLLKSLRLMRAAEREKLAGLLDKLVSGSGILTSEAPLFFEE